MLHRSDEELRSTGHSLDVRHTVMAVTVNTVAVPLVVGQLLVIPLFRIDGDHRRNPGFRFASDSINRPAKHDAQKQQQGCKAPSASNGQAEEHLVGFTILGFTFSHSSSR